LFPYTTLFRSQQSVNVLHPSYHKVRAAVPDEMLARVDQAFKKVSQAFSVLTNSSKRAQYDEQRNPRTYATLPLDASKAKAQQLPGPAQPRNEATVKQ